MATPAQPEQEILDMGHVAPQPTALLHQSGPMALLEMAIKNQSAIDVIERLAALQEKMLTRDAETQFNEAMNKAQSEITRIPARHINTQTNSKWADYADLDRALRPIYIRHGFSLSFDTAESRPETVRAICYVSHQGGHTRKYQSPEMPADGKGPKGGDVMTKTHATGSAMSYAMRYLLKYIFNVAIGEDDNDGNGGSPAMADLQERLDWVENCRNLDELEKIGFDAYRAAEAAKDQRAMGHLIVAKGKKAFTFCSNWDQLQTQFAKAYSEARKLGDVPAQQALIEAKDKQRAGMRK